MLAHKAEDEGIALAELLAGKPGHVNYDTIPERGLHRARAGHGGPHRGRAQGGRGIRSRPAASCSGANGRAKSLGQLDGMVKILAHKETDEILGVHMVGPAGLRADRRGASWPWSSTPRPRTSR